MTATRLAQARFVVGIACVAVAAAWFCLHVPRTVDSMDGAVRGYAYIRSPLVRVTTSGDMLGLPYDLQVKALALIPPRSEYALVLPKTLKEAASYGIIPVTYDVAQAYFRYLLLPAWPVDPAEARYVICYGCNTDPWDHHTAWLWKDDKGNAIGRVGGR